MKNKHVIFILFCLSAFSISAQTLEEAKELFKNGQFEQAKPAFYKLLKSTPKNPNYNFWYGACCYETGEKNNAENKNIRSIGSVFLFLKRILRIFAESIKYSSEQTNQHSNHMINN